MSYILEALKKSQQEREMGQVPRLQTTAFDDPLEPARAQPWAWAAVGLAGLALVLALYVALRPAAAPGTSALNPLASNAEPNQASEVGALLVDGQDQRSERPSATAAEAATGLDLGSDGRSRTASARASLERPSADRSATADARAAVAPPLASAAPLGLSDPDNLSVEPQVLVVPAPPKPGQRLPRGADELRRAVLGPDASPSIERRQPSPSSPIPERDFTPVPPELIAEIEDFKRTYQSGSRSASAGSQQGAPRDRTAVSSKPRETGAGRSAPPGQRASGSSRPAPLSSSVRRQLPPFLMTVHVYDEDPARRFVYLNGSKVREGELTRDGFFVEQVLADGAIVRYDDHRFFETP